MPCISPEKKDNEGSNFYVESLEVLVIECLWQVNCDLQVKDLLSMLLPSTFLKKSNLLLCIIE